MEAKDALWDVRSMRERERESTLASITPNARLDELLNHRGYSKCAVPLGDTR